MWAHFLFEDRSDLWFFPAASFANPSKYHIFHWDPGDLIHCLDPELLPIWEGPQTPCFRRCHRLVSLSHLEGRTGLQLVVFQFPQGVWTWALALWPGRIELFGPRDGDRNTMSSITWPVDVMFGWTPQFSRVALTLYYLVHSQLIHLSSGPQKH